MRIVDWKRFISVVAILMIVIITLFSNCSAVKKIETEDVVISAGDTLWSISCEYKKDGQDVREYLYELRKLNNLTDCTIYPGQEIKIIK